jgi:hypothetical protein
MQEAAPNSPLQLLFVELRVGLARSAIQAALLLNGGGAVAVLLFIAMVVAAPAQGIGAVKVLPLKWALALFGLGMFIAGMTFVNAYIAQGAIASGRSSAFGTVMRRLGLGLIVASLLLFLTGVGLAVTAI